MDLFDALFAVIFLVLLTTFIIAGRRKVTDHAQIYKRPPLPEPTPSASAWVEKNLPKKSGKKKYQRPKSSGTSGMIGTRETISPRKPTPTAPARKVLTPTPAPAVQQSSNDDGGSFIAGAILGAAVASIAESDDRPAPSVESGGGGDFGGGGASGSWDDSSSSSSSSDSTSSSDSGSFDTDN